MSYLAITSDTYLTSYINIAQFQHLCICVAESLFSCHGIRYSHSVVYFDPQILFVSLAFAFCLTDTYLYFIMLPHFIILNKQLWTWVKQYLDMKTYN